MDGVEVFSVSEIACLGCGACCSIAPQMFTLREAVATIARQPVTPEDRDLARAALVNCPSSAIGVRSEAS
jgi:ferredoxin